MGCLAVLTFFGFSWVWQWARTKANQKEADRLVRDVEDTE